MLEKLTEKDELTFKDISPEEREKRGILGRLYGTCASTIKATRNGRYYSDELWEKVFQNPINQELLKEGGIPGELDHPVDRLETDSSKIAIMMPEAPKKDKDGHLVGYWDIIDTPCGKIAHALAKYGFKFGISSRGNGETYTDNDGNEEVDPNSYEFSAFDLVLVPACADARLSLITEGVDTKQKALKKALNESLNEATPEDRKIMEETLKDLNIEYSDNKEEKEQLSESEQGNNAANDDGAELIKTLQETILAKDKAEAKITELQEKLSVCYAKEASMNEDLDKCKASIRKLSESSSKVRDLQKEIVALNEQLKQEQIKSKNLMEKITLNENRKSALNEKLSNRDNQLKTANQKIESLTEKLENREKEFSEEKSKLNENYETLKKDYRIKQTEYSNKLSASNKLVEQYKKTAEKAVSYYIESKARSLGLNSQEIKNKLPKNYSFSDIDSICENLSSYNLKINSLPFDVRSVKNVQITESKKLPGSEYERFADGDDVDESLIRLANNMIQNN